MALINDAFIVRNNYKECLSYIEKQWKNFTHYHPKDKHITIGLPHPFVSPNGIIYKNDQFYWDSYFVILGLVKCGRAKLAKGIVDNFLFMQKRFGIIPMRNRYYNLGTSQPPFLTSMINEVLSEIKDKRWKKKAMAAAEKEFTTYWMHEKLTEVHLVYKGLSRYCDHYITHAAAEHESGWDMTSRFHDHCLDYLPVDLNSLLYKYEIDLAAFYKSAGNESKHKFYVSLSGKRKRHMHELMWNADKGFYFDYDYAHKKQSAFYSIAGFYPMWANLATASQAEKMAENLHEFEYPFGLANTQSTKLADEYRQHDYPNGWPHQQWIVIKGLLNYGYNEEAVRIAKKYLDLNKKLFKETGKFWEKFNVVKGEVAYSERYATQPGFGWTNAVFVRIVSELGK